MKTSIAITLIITAAVFSFVSGYSIGTHSDQSAGYGMARQSSGVSVATAANAAEKAPAGGYGSPSVETSNNNATASPGYGAPSPGYGK
jgi:hypothetical protein